VRSRHRGRMPHARMHARPTVSETPQQAYAGVARTNAGSSRRQRRQVALAVVYRVTHKRSGCAAEVGATATAAAGAGAGPRSRRSSRGCAVAAPPHRSAGCRPRDRISVPYSTTTNPHVARSISPRSIDRCEPSSATIAVRQTLLLSGYALAQH